jgi:hypothetical protein
VKLLVTVEHAFAAFGRGTIVAPELVLGISPRTN